VKGFLISFFFNLIFRLELLALAIIALLLSVYFHLPIAFFYVLLGLWIGIALLITLGLGVLTKGTPRSPSQKNVNPYSKKTSDYIKKNDDNNGSDKES
jgi:ABC-type transport system involved in multi-copper enzyme maturation permease subunit